MNMQRKYFWSIFGLLLTALIFIQYGILKQYNLSYNLDKYYLTIDLISLVLTIIVISIGLTLIIAIIPFREKSFKTKFKQISKISIILVLLIMVFTYGFLASKGVRYPTMVNYDEVQTCSSNDCLLVTEGNFETETIMIERIGNFQIETAKESNKKTEYEVKWISVCEYHLIPKNSSEKTIKVKITKVEPEFYECAAAIEKDVHRSKIFIVKKTVANNGE